MEATNERGEKGREEPEGIPQLFGMNVRKYRRQAGLTQEQLSARIKVSQKHLSIVENGSQFASAQLIGKLSAALGVSPAMLFGGYEQEVNYEEVNATAAILQQYISSQMAVLHSRLDRIEALLLAGKGQ